MIYYDIGPEEEPDVAWPIDRFAEHLGFKYYFTSYVAQDQELSGLIKDYPFLGHESAGLGYSTGHWAIPLEEILIWQERRLIFTQAMVSLHSTSLADDPARPVPGLPMPSQEEINAAVEIFGWENTRIITANSPEVIISAAYLCSISRQDMAQYLEYLAKAGLIRAAPFAGFLAAVYKKGIILSVHYLEYSTTAECAASLVHEIGATAKFKLSHAENFARETAFKVATEVLDIDEFGRRQTAVIANGVAQGPLVSAIAEIKFWKEAHADILDQRTGNPFSTHLQEAAKDIYIRYAIYTLPIKERLVFVHAVFEGKRYARIRHAIGILTRRVRQLDIGPEQKITPAQYYSLANMLSEMEGQYTIIENRYLRLGMNLVFDIWEQEKRILEQMYLVEEIEKELNFPGSGNLPFIVAMQDLHGGARRATALVGFALGLPADIYEQIHTLEDLKSLLAEYGIDIKDLGVRLVGLNDKYDRGNDPISTFELVKWLREEGKAKPFSGNHDDWRTWGVLGVHLLFESTGIDYKSPEVKNHHIAYWARDAFKHTGWGDIELEQVNQRRFIRLPQRLTLSCG
jgi:hypothetical protein